MLAIGLLLVRGVREITFAEATAVLPKHNRSPLVIAAALHLLLFAVLIQVKSKPVRVSSAGSPDVGIAAYVSGPIGGTPASAPKPEAKKTALKTEVVKNAPKDDASDANTAVGTAGVAGTGQAGGGPVHLGSGGNITLVRKVQPVYPPMFQSARVPGQVVLDAIIHADGTIGDVTILKSTNEAFARSAADAVKQWKYVAIGFEAIVTVTVNFLLT